MRILCLFEDDIVEVNNFLLELFEKKGYDFAEFKIYNWTNHQQIKLLLKSVETKFPTAKNKDLVKTKDSGYKSLHYIIFIKKGAQSFPIEIQLRTLLQDVWGELEHSLSYKKGTIHPHIKKSFSLLAKDLENSDNLLSHLKKISEKEKYGTMHTKVRSTPMHYFCYEDALIPQLFRTKRYSPLFKNYSKLMKVITRMSRV